MNAPNSVVFQFAHNFMFSFIDLDKTQNICVTTMVIFFIQKKCSIYI